MLFLLSLFLLFLPAVTPPDSPVEWIGERSIDVGDIPQDVGRAYTFYFRNVTDAPLIIDNVRVGCGCTATDWVDTPVAPGEEGMITVTYDAASRGYFRKYAKVFFEGHRGGHRLWVEGFVVLSSGR